MTSPTVPIPSTLDFAAAARWPTRAAAHLLGVALVLAVVVALPTAPTDLDRHQLPKETVVHLLTWLAVLLSRPTLSSGLRPAARWSLAALVAITVVSGLFATDGWLALRAASLVITGAAAFVTARFLAAAGLGSVILAWCGAAGVIGAGTGMAQAYGAHSIFFATTRIPGGTFGNRNFMAHFSGLALPVLLLGAFTSRRQFVAIGASIGCALLVAAIVLSRSRAAWIGAGSGSLVFAAILLAARRRQSFPAIKTRAIALVTSVALGVVAAMVIPNRLAWRSPSPYLDTVVALANHDEGSGHGRVLQYRNTLRLAARHPLLGVGPGNWPRHYGEVAPASDPTWVFGDVVPINPWPSSDWMALVSEMGFAATLAALLFGAAIAWRGVVGARASGDRVAASAALLALLTTLFVEGNFDAVMLLPAQLLFVALAAGTLSQWSDGRRSVENIETEPRRFAKVLPLVLGLIALRSTMQTAAYMVAGNGRSTARLIWAARVDPGSYPIRIALAQRESCDDAHNDIVAAIRMAPTWPATTSAAARCGVRIRR